MKKKYVKPLILIAAFLILTIMTSASYAFFTASVNGNASANVITTGTMQLLFTDGDGISLENAIPGSSIIKTFKVKNVGSVDTNYDLYLSKITNSFDDKNDLVYKLESSNGCADGIEKVVPDEVGEQSKISALCYITPNVEHVYTLTITFKDD